MYARTYASHSRARVPFRRPRHPGSDFGLQFQEAAAKTGSHITHDSFSTSVIEIQREDAQKFMDYLHYSLMA